MIKSIKKAIILTNYIWSVLGLWENIVKWARTDNKTKEA